MVDLKVKIADLEFANPLLTASGTFGYGSEIEDLYDVNILGGIVTKTITTKRRPGNPPERIAETTAGMLNSIGLANVGIEGFIHEKLPYLKQLSTKVIVNVAGESTEDFIELVQQLEDHDGIDGYELNLSCPNVSGGLDFSIDPKITYEVTKKVRKCTKRCLIPKLTPNVTDVTTIAVAAEDAGADALSLINTIVGMSINVKNREPSLGRVMGGLSGPAIKPIALAKVYSVCKKVSVPVIGIGGISSAKDVLEFIIAGATAVQLGTINFVDPMAPVKILKEIETYLIDAKILSVKDLMGTVKV